MPDKKPTATDPQRPDPREAGPKPPFQTQSEQASKSVSEMTPKSDHGEDAYVGSGRLKGCAALITGGDSGIGRAVALAFAREGANVAITYHSNASDAREAEALLREAGGRVEVFQLDQTDVDACESTVDKAVSAFGRLDILVNNAAFQKSYGSFEEIPVEDFELTFRTNVFGNFYMSRAAVKVLKPGGCIINSASIQSFDPSMGLAPYSATKAAIASLTLSLAPSAIQKGIRVNAVAPGPVWTPLIPTTLPDEKVKHFGENTLFKRPAQPAELAPVYVFLASKEASYVTGEIYGVTGGRLQL